MDMDMVFSYIFLLMHTCSYLLIQMHLGHGHGHGMGGPPVDKDSFVQNEMRSYAMKLHTRDQAPREGQQKAEKPFTTWEPKRENYLQFLVDSLVVYETLDNIVAR